MRGIIYGVGVGPGDPELITLKAVRLIRESPVIAFPGKSARDSLACQIASAVVPDLERKELVPIDMPMRRDPSTLAAAHQAGADRLKHYADRGSNVAYLTLGDPSIYCSFRYLQDILEADGYPVELVSGVPSFCAGAARLRMPLAMGEEALHIIPGAALSPGMVLQSGSYVFMKPGNHLERIRALLRNSGRTVGMVENCGLHSERCYTQGSELPQQAGYFSIVIAK